MTRDEFWNLIEKSGPRASDAEGVQVKTLQRLLEALPIEEIVSFQVNQGQLMHESYRADLWNIIYIVDGGCSDDGFDYFRFWLMLQGRATFNRVLANPRLIAEFSRGECSLTNQDFGSVALEAYEKVTGESDMLYDGPTGPGTLQGKLLDEAGRKKAYPDLWKRFIENG